MSPTPLRAAEPGDLGPIGLRTPPHNVEVERALLGAILLNNRSYEKVSETLRAEHFTEAVNGRIYAALSVLIDQGHQANPVTLKTYLERDDLVIAAGGMKYLATLSNSMVTVVNVADYARLIYDLHLRRELIGIGEDMVNDAFEAHIDVTAEEQVEQVEEKLFDLVMKPGTGGLVAFDKAFQSAATIAEAAHNRGGALVGLTTGLRDLDAKLGGLFRSDLIILAGRPSMGKTALATKEAVSAARYFATTDQIEDQGKQVAFFSLEMSKEQLVHRVLAEEARIDSHKIRTGKLSDDEFGRFMQTGTALHNLPLYIDDTPAATVGAIRTRARRLARQKGLGLIVIDYLQLISPGGRERPENRVQEVSAITRGLKALAKELNVPVVALSQLSRAVENRDEKRPQLADLRESGTIEQDSDVVKFVFREEYYLERAEPSDASKFAEWRAKMDAVANIAEVIVAKQRHGPIGTVKLHFNAGLTAFSDLEARSSDGEYLPKRSAGIGDGRPEPPPLVQEEFPL